MNPLAAFDFLCQCLAPFYPHSTNRSVLVYTISDQAIDWDEVILCAGHHLVTPALYFFLNEKNLIKCLDSELQDYLKTIFSLNRARND